MRAIKTSFFLCSTVAVALVTATGCSSSQDETQAATDAPGWAESANTSGSRLRAKVISGGGAREVVGFFDTLRKEDCSFRLADGKYRCLPEAVFQQFGGLFADAGCRTPLLSVQTCQPDPKYLMSIGGVGCSTSVVTGIKRINGPAQGAFVATGTGCQPSSAVTSTLKGFVIGDDVPLDQFVDAVETPVANGALTETVLVASDGARQHLSYRIAALDAECTFQVMADGITRCVPRAQTTQIYYLDSDCTVPARAASSGSSGGGCSSGSDLVREIAPAGGSCGAARNVFKLADEPAAEAGDPSTFTGDTPLYTASNSSTGPSCTQIQSWNRSYTRPVINVTLTLPSTDRIGRGGGRLVPTLVTQASTEELVAGWHDSERNVDCTFVKASDGKMRCLPTGASGVVFFTDTACKAPTLVAVRGGPLSCAQAASKYVRVTPNPTTNPGQPQPACAPPDPLTKVYELTGDVKNLGPSSFESTPGRCAQVQGVNGALDAKEVDPALFVEGALVTE